MSAPTPAIACLGAIRSCGVVRGTDGSYLVAADAWGHTYRLIVPCRVVERTVDPLLRTHAGAVDEGTRTAVEGELRQLKATLCQFRVGGPHGATCGRDLPADVAAAAAFAAAAAPAGNMDPWGSASSASAAAAPPRPRTGRLGGGSMPRPPPAPTLHEASAPQPTEPQYSHLSPTARRVLSIMGDLRPWSPGDRDLAIIPGEPAELASTPHLLSLFNHITSHPDYTSGKLTPTFRRLPSLTSFLRAVDAMDNGRRLTQALRDIEREPSMRRRLQQLVAVRYTGPALGGGVYVAALPADCGKSAPAAHVPPAAVESAIAPAPAAALAAAALPQAFTPERGVTAKIGEWTTTNPTSATSPEDKYLERWRNTAGMRTAFDGAVTLPGANSGAGDIYDAYRVWTPLVRCGLMLGMRRLGDVENNYGAYLSSATESLIALFARLNGGGKSYGRVQGGAGNRSREAQASRGEGASGTHGRSADKFGVYTAGFAPDPKLKAAVVKATCLAHGVVADGKSD
ncbi:hypothetical protein TeGR_g6692 [Tetraparma gracilis]|uniref:Uncharacterized protein n=1 Tax=Tetraparma gracilis TaxID=2962635 RepID=A0ABQ6N6N5_9STRA|nr:hypothetical protein TeGR_g6692 [Tetraparma gracilis]